GVGGCVNQHRWQLVDATAGSTASVAAASASNAGRAPCRPSAGATATRIGGSGASVGATGTVSCRAAGCLAATRRIAFAPGTAQRKDGSGRDSRCRRGLPAGAARIRVRLVEARLLVIVFCELWASAELQSGDGYQKGASGAQVSG